MSEEEKKKKSIPFAFDFDGVIMQYDGFKGVHHSNEPIEEVVKAIRMLKAKGHKILIYSTRGEAFLREYCEQYDIPVDYYNENPDYDTEGRKPVAFAYIDDRAVRYSGQSAEELLDELENFKAHWEEGDGGA